MSEKIFACLLRLYPSQFRKKYTEEVVQLYRDLHRDESGLLRRIVLRVGLLVDLALGLPLAYRNTYASAAVTPVAQGIQGVPTFRMLELEPMRPGRFLFGSLFTLALLGAFSVVLSLPVVYHDWGTSSFSRSPIEAVLEKLNQPRPSGLSGKDSPRGGDGRSVGVQASDSVATDRSMIVAQKTTHSTPKRQVVGSGRKSPEPHSQHQQMSKKAGEPAPQKQENGVSMTTAEASVSTKPAAPIAQSVTRDAQHAVALNSVANPSKSGLSANAAGPNSAKTKQQDCSFETIKVLPNNIGYFKLDSLPNPAHCGASADGAMARLNNTSAIILDLRENRGGFTEMEKQIGAWFVGRPATQGITHFVGRSSRLGEKPIYILTSSQTADSARQFAYRLKKLGRTTVIGERIHGLEGKKGQDQRKFFPDVEVKASDALAVAEKTARVQTENR